MKYYVIVSENGWGISNNEGYPYTSCEYNVTELLISGRLFRRPYKSVPEVKQEIVSAQKMFPAITYGIFFSYVEVDIDIDNTVWSVEQSEVDTIMLDSILNKLDPRDAKFVREQMDK